MSILHDTDDDAPLTAEEADAIAAQYRRATLPTLRYSMTREQYERLGTRPATRAAGLRHDHVTQL